MDKKKWSERVENLPLGEKIERSKEVIKEVMKKKDKDTPLIVNFSGGKDSVACLLLVKMVTDDVVAFYVDGGFDLPDTLPYVKSQSKKFGVKLEVARAGVDLVAHRKNGPISHCQLLEDYVKHYEYFPTSGCRWCSIWLKQRVMKAFWRKRFDRSRVLYKINGVRMFESSVRKWKYGDEKHFQKYSVDGTPYLRYDNEHKPCITVLPIVEWTDKDVKNFLKQEGVTIHKGYKKYGFSGCKWCPVHKRENYVKALNIDINLYNDFIELEETTGKPCGPNEEYLRDIKKEVLSKLKEEE
jgi:3'-phosphoadenosine 5'-phosphosulfate sulfotransferase (PAPS reductase)/FAD synthetase